MKKGKNLNKFESLVSVILLICYSNIMYPVFNLLSTWKNNGTHHYWAILIVYFL